jgi:arginine decarboxylase
MPNISADCLVARKIFLTKGVGRHRYQLKSFEEALRDAGVANQNLVQVSSILPPKCKIVSRESGLKELVPGAIAFCVMARADTNEHGRLVASSIGMAVPKDRNNWGYLSEVHRPQEAKKVYGLPLSLSRCSYLINL